MRSAFKAFIISGLALSLVGLTGFSPAQLGKPFFAVAQALEWSQPALIRVVGFQMKDENQDEITGQVKIELEDGQTFPVAPRAKFKNEKGDPIALSSFTAPSKVRFLLEKGVVIEMVLIEALPR
ncbi:MAG TPA: hypothetical protein VFH55_11850 [Nitrospiria bacterium]|nr:hypothetical protein [Nitrospiria bacterium]